MSRFVTENTYVCSTNGGGSINTATFVQGDPANDLQVMPATAGSVPLGICGIGPDLFPTPTATGSVNATSGEVVEVYAPGSTVPLTAGVGGWGPFQFLKPDATGNGIVANPGDIAGAYSLTTAAAGDIPEVLQISPTVVPTPSGAITSTAVSVALTTGGTVFVTAADVTVTLPLVALKASVRVISNAATATLQAGAVGTLLAINAADVTAGTVKMFGHDITTPAFSKGLVNTHTTAVQGDSVEVRSDGTSWFEFPVNGTWTRQA
jgi:hypothetical protein